MRGLTVAMRHDRIQLLAGVMSWAAAGAWILYPESTAAAGVLGMMMLGLGFLAPAWAFVLLALIVPFELGRELGHGFTVYTGEMALVAGLPGWVWNIMRRVPWQRPMAPAEAWIAPFLLGMAISLVWAHNLIAVKGSVRWLEFVLVVIAGVHILRRGKDAERVLWALVASATVSAAQGYLQTCAGPGVYPQLNTIHTTLGEVTRASAGFGASTLAAFLMLIGPFAASAALFHPQGWGRCAGWMGSGIMATAFILTFSLTGLVALAAVMAATLFILVRKLFGVRSSLVGAAAVLALTALLVGWNWDAVVQIFWKEKMPSLLNRLEYLRVGVLLFLQSPWVGIGPGMYRHLAPGLSSAAVNPVGLLSHPHSFWLNLLAELGAVGLATLVYAGVQAGRFLIRRIQNATAAWPVMAGWSVIVGLIGFAAANASEHCLVHDRGMHAALALAAALVWVRRPPRPRRPESRRVFDQVWAQPQDEDWESVLGQRRQGRQPLYALLNQALAHTPAARILELGCGPALDALNLAAESQREVHALDISSQALSCARRAAQALGRTLTLHQGDVRRTEFPAQHFDLIFSQGLWEHFPDSQPLWQESVRLLKPGGYLILDVPQAWNPYTLVKWWHQVAGDWPWGWETQYTVGSLSRMASRYGLQRVAARGYGYRGGRWDWTAALRNVFSGRFPQAWQTWEQRTGAWWMMNVVVAWQNPEVHSGQGAQAVGS